MLPPEIKAWRTCLQQYDLQEDKIGFVYFLCKESTVRYVGQSSNVSSRIATHSSANKIDFDNAYYLVVPLRVMPDIEKAYIRALQPPDNKIGTVQAPNERDWEFLANIEKYVEEAKLLKNSELSEKEEESKEDA